MRDLIEAGRGPSAAVVMRDLAALAVRKNGGEPIPANPEDVAALEVAQANLYLAGIHTGPCAIKGTVEVAP